MNYIKCVRNVKNTSHCYELWCYCVFGDNCFGLLSSLGSCVLSLFWTVASKSAWSDHV